MRIDDELYVKRLQKLPKYRLISDNKSYENVELEGRIWRYQCGCRIFQTNDLREFKRAFND